jgi:predicted DsbA family dithiol-disulfide isomerase
VNVEIWSDVVCPWCYIGKRRFERALGRFEHADEVEIVYRSFELDPGAPAVPTLGMVELLARKYGHTVEAAQAMLADMDRLAASEGLDYRLEETTGGNTFDAHRLLHLARDHGRNPAVKEALLHAYFIDRRPISDPEVLRQAAVEGGLPAEEVDAVLAGDQYATDVRADEAEARSLGATGVPFAVVDRLFALPGAQDADAVLAVLRRAWGRSHPGASAPGGAVSNPR